MRTSVAFLVLFALDRRRFHLQARNEGLQAGKAVLFVVECEGQEFVEDVADLGAEPPEIDCPPAVLPKDLGVEIMDGQGA